MADSLEHRLAEAEKRLQAIESKPRDFWDKFQIVVGLLIPASITLAGYLYSEAAKQAEIQSTERMAAQQQAVSQIQTKVGQAQLISTFMDALLSENPQRQRLAIEAVLVALPEDGPRLVSIVSQDRSRPEVRAAALSSLDQRRTRLIDEAFSGDKATRIRATTELVQGWRSDPLLVPRLIEVAAQKRSNASGVINALVILENVAQASLDPHRDAIQNFLNLVRANGPQTETHVRQVEARLGSR